MSVRLFLLVPVLALLLGLLPPSADCATIYRYTDASGNVCFTDNLKSLPAKFRKDAVPFTPPAGGVVNSSQAPANSTTAAPSPAAIVLPPAAVGAAAMAQDYWQKPWVQGSAFLVGVFVVFLLLLKILEYLPSRNFGRLILLIFFLGTATFGYKLFVEEMLLRYAAAKEETTRVVNEVNKRQEARYGDLPAAR